MGRKNKTIDKIPLSWAPCTEADAIAIELIKEDHGHLRGVTIDCYLQSTELRERGNKVAAISKKVAGFSAYMAGSKPDAEKEPWPFFVILIHTPTWFDMTELQKRALIDHHLSGMYKDDKGKLSFKAPDVIAYRGNVQRYGLWTDDLKLGGRTMAEKLQGELELIDNTIPHGKGVAANKEAS